MRETTQKADTRRKSDQNRTQPDDKTRATRKVKPKTLELGSTDVPDECQKANTFHFWGQCTFDPATRSRGYVTLPYFAFIVFP